MNTPHDLEDRLREHYAVKAGELRLPDVSLDDVLAGGDVPVRAVAAAPHGRTALLVAAALVGGAVIGAGALQLTRDEPSAGDRSVDVSRSEPGALPGGEPFAPCPEGEVPEDLEPIGLQNDIRVAGALLPATTPAGHCVYDHQVQSLSGAGAVGYQVWTDCGECERPTAAVARVTTYQEDLESGETSDPESVEVNGHRGRFYPADETNPLARLYLDTGADLPLTLVGWGLDEEAFVLIAAELTVDDGTANEVAGMELVYDRLLPEYSPGLIPFTSNLTVWYASDAGESFLRYALLDHQETPPLEGYAWIRPHAVISTVGGRRTLSFAASPSIAGTEESVVIIQIDATTQVLWSSRGTPPLSADDLAAIELTPADVDDWRWLEIAYESGNSEAVG